jgi:outer membrane protein assembly factor BamB
MMVWLLVNIENYAKQDMNMKTNRIRFIAAQSTSLAAMARDVPSPNQSTKSLVTEWPQARTGVCWMSFCHRMIGLAVIAILSARPLSADDRFSGFLTGNVSVDSPSQVTTWSPESVTWQATLAGYGQSTPVVHDGVAYVTSVSGENKDRYYLEAFSLRRQERMWGVELPNAHPVASTPMVSRSAPTPVVDEQSVYAFYESGQLVAVDRSGRLVWETDLQEKYGEFSNEFGLSSSPVQTRDSVIVLVDHDGPSYLVAFNKTDGVEQWRTDRGVRYRSWSSPGIVRVGNEEIVVCSSAGTIDGYDARSGRLRFSNADVGGNTAATPIDLGHRQFLVSSLIRPADGPSENALESNLLAEINGEGDQMRLDIKWIAKDARGSFSSPVASEKFCYFTTAQGVLYCIDRATGEELFKQRLDCGMCWATPIVAGEFLYLFGKSGQSMAIRISERFEPVASDNRVWSDDEPLVAQLGEEKTPESIRQRMTAGTQYGVVMDRWGMLVRRGDRLYFMPSTEHAQNLPSGCTSQPGR